MVLWEIFFVAELIQKVVDENARNYLNSIQKQEQNHGKMIYDYMSANSMY